MRRIKLNEGVENTATKEELWIGAVGRESNENDEEA